jgi:hypothetical protein
MDNRSIRLIALTALVAAGCAPYATYPPIEVTSGLAGPTMEPFPALMAQAIQATHEAHGGGAPDFAYNLPPGSPRRLYGDVQRRLGAGHAMGREGESAYHVTVVRARGTEAEVDMVVPQPGGTYGLLTISFHNKLGKGWYVRGQREWAIHVEAPSPTYPASEQLTASEGSAGRQP